MNFDLNIDNYSKSDIENLLDLTFPYNYDTIHERCSIFKKSIEQNTKLDKNLVITIDNFLDNIKLKIVSSLSNSENQLISQTKFENPNLKESNILTMGSTSIIEQQMRTDKSKHPNSMLPPNLSYSISGNEAPGRLNPLYKRNVFKSLTIDSRFRNDYYNTSSSDFLVNLPISFNNVISMKLSSLELPTTYYSISKTLGNSHFYIIIRISSLFCDFINSNLDSICLGIVFEGNIYNISNVSHTYEETSDTYKNKFQLENPIGNIHYISKTNFYGNDGSEITELGISDDSISVSSFINSMFLISLITIPDGNYNHTNMTKEINNSLELIFTNQHIPDATTSPSVPYCLKIFNGIGIYIDIADAGTGSGLTMFASTVSNVSNYAQSSALADNTDNAYSNGYIQIGSTRTPVLLPVGCCRFSLNFAAPLLDKSLVEHGFLNSFNYLKSGNSSPSLLTFGSVLGFRLGEYTSFEDLTKPYTGPSYENSDSINTSISVFKANKNLSEIGCSYVSESFFECAGPRYLFLVVEDFNNNVSDGLFSALNSSILNQNILARISVKGAPFSVLADDSLNVTKPERIYFGPVNLDKLRIQILDEFGRIVNLNNMDFSMELVLNTLYDK